MQKDVIYRQDAIDYCYQLINVEHEQGSDEMNYGRERVNQTETILHHLEFMPSAQSDHSGDVTEMVDLIERQAAIDAMSVGEELLTRVLDDMDIVGNERKKYEWGLGLIKSCINDIKELPSAQPERKTGKWIDNSRKDYEQYYCSECFREETFKSNYCPNCGADMKR